MKKLFLLTLVGLRMVSTEAQFSPMPLTFPGNGYYTWFNSVVDTNTVWVGTDYVNSSYQSYAMAIRTTDGGITWQFNPIPDNGLIIINNVNSIDANTCYYTLANGTGGAIWKTTDGGTSWTKKTTTQFNGGWPNFYYPFSADTGVAVGDPNGGDWEIYLTYNGGNTWTRVSSSNIPASLNGEYGSSSAYSVFNQNIWFATNKGRCYKSTDKGQTWSVSQVGLLNTGNPNVCFIDNLRGVFWIEAPYLKKNTATYHQYYVTTDGGSSWNEQNLPDNLFIRDFCAIPGISGGMMISANDTLHNKKLTILYTDDFLNTLKINDTAILSDGILSFKNSYTGWMSGFALPAYDIYKFTGNLIPYAGIQNNRFPATKLKVVPNPSVSDAILYLPHSPGPQGKSSILISDISGRIVGTRIIEELSNQVHLNAGAYPDGIYFIQTLSENGTSAFCRWIINH